MDPPLRQGTDRERWFGKARRGYGIAPFEIFHKTRAPVGPEGIAEHHSDFARRKYSTRPKG